MPSTALQQPVASPWSPRAYRNDPRRFLFPGADVVLTDPAKGANGAQQLLEATPAHFRHAAHRRFPSLLLPLFPGAVAKKNELMQTIPNAVNLDQFGNPVRRTLHRHPSAPALSLHTPV